MAINYQDYKPMIISRALAWSQVTGWELDDLISEGNVAFCKASQSFQEKKGVKFSTYFYNALNIHYGNMLNLARCQCAEKRAEADSAFCSSHHNTEREGIFRAILNDLPEDAKEVVKAIFETPNEILEVLGITKVSKNTIFQYFTKLQGWTQSRVWKAFRTIQENLL